MADAVRQPNGNGKAKWIAPLVLSVAIAVVGWMLAAQSWGKDAGHQTINAQIDRNSADIAECKETTKSVVETMRSLEVNQARILANQESMSRTLERLERRNP